MCKTSYTVLHDILVSKFERHGFDVWNMSQIRNWWDGSTRRTLVNSSVLRWSQWHSSRIDTWIFNIFVGDMMVGLNIPSAGFPEPSSYMMQSACWKEGMASRQTLTGQEVLWYELYEVQQCQVQGSPSVLV